RCAASEEAWRKRRERAARGCPPFSEILDLNRAALEVRKGVAAVRLVAGDLLVSQEANGDLLSKEVALDDVLAPMDPGRQPSAANVPRQLVKRATHGERRGH